MSRRLPYALLSLFLFALCAFIVLAFSRQPFVRGFVGDMLIVGIIYCLCKLVRNFRPLPLALAVLAFSFAAEVAQYFHALRRFGFQENFVTRILFGSVFDPFDLLAYTAGAASILAADVALIRRPLK